MKIAETIYCDAAAGAARKSSHFGLMPGNNHKKIILWLATVANIPLFCNWQHSNFFRWLATVATFCSYVAKRSSSWVVVSIWKVLQNKSCLPLDVKTLSFINANMFRRSGSFLLGVFLSFKVSGYYREGKFGKSGEWELISGADFVTNINKQQNKWLWGLTETYVVKYGCALKCTDIRI